MSDDQPYFRFNPGAYGDGHSFERSSDVCDVCSRPCVWKYMGSVYATDRPVVCARCIANGELGRSLGEKHFSLHDIEMNGAEPSLKKEVLQRTPGVACYNPFELPVLDAKPLAFVGYGEDQDLLDIAAVRSAIEAAFAEIGRKFDAPTSYALVFKEIDGERYRRLSTSIEATLLTGSPYRGYRVIDLGFPDRNSIRQNSMNARAGAGSSALLDQARPTSMVGICALTSRDSSLSPSSDHGR